jgi:perosamine synthetase
MIRLFKVFMSEYAASEVTKVLNSGYVGEGPKTKEFEQAFEKFVGLEGIKVVNSGTSAIDLVLHMCGVGPGTEVISTPITCTATNGNIINRGAKIVWADVDANGLIDPTDVKNKITSKTKLIIGVNWGGSMPDYAALKSFGIPVLEDAAHGPYGVKKERGDYIIWSFQAIKFLTTVDGGALFSPDPERVRFLRWFGLDRESSASFRCAQNIQEVGYKYQSNDIASTIGLENLLYTPHLVRKHKVHAEYYFRHIKDTDHVQKLEYDPDSTYWIYTILVDNVATFTEYMRKKDIEVSPVHSRNDKHDGFGGFDHSLVGVKAFDDHQVSIPVGYWLTDQNREYIIDAVNNYKGKP